MSEPRFSKSRFREDLEQRAENIRKRCGFDPKNGWAQVMKSATPTKVEYGRYSMLCDLIEELYE